jgi:phospholipid/cholesterol/gamma-HCH transport system ATP-binding protein
LATERAPRNGATAAGGASLVEFRGLFKRFGDKEVLRGVDMRVNRGETQVIMGSSGSGKSVLLSMLVGLLSPDKGEVLVDGEDVTHFSTIDEWRRVWLRTGFLFQGAALFDSMNVGENIAFPLREHSTMDEQQIAARVSEVLSWIDLEGIEQKMPSELSGGMQKRVGLARAIVLEPEIVVYDEPTTGLDPLTSDTISELIRRLQRERQITSIVVTHDVRCAFLVADRIAMLDEGRILVEGPLEEIKNSEQPKLRAFLYG